MKLMSEEDFNKIAYALLKYEIKTKGPGHFDYSKKAMSGISKKIGISVEELVAFGKIIKKEVAEEVFSNK